jgi:electron transfer flavoprotein alpha subunit
MTTAAGILIVAEPAGDTLPSAVFELVSMGRRLSQQGAGPVSVALLAEAPDACVAALAACGVDRICTVAIAGLVGLPVEARVHAVAQVCRHLQPRIVLAAHSPTGTELAPRLAFRLEGAVATGCVDAVFADGHVSFTRPCYGGSAREQVRLKATPAVATVRAGVFEPATAMQGPPAVIEAVHVAMEGVLRTRLIARELDAAEGVRLEDARVIVAGGRGLEGPEGFRVLEELANELGGAVGASRVPCDLGWCPHSWQIGLTGKTVTPELYVAVGISGAGHHMAGCGNARTIVAINTDAQAAIFLDARFGVVGDFREIVPALAAEVRRLKEETP